MKELLDITVPIQTGMAVYPGDNPPEREWLRTIGNRDRINLSTLTLGSHTGTHVDAPFHFDEKGMTLDQVPLSTFVGEAVVIQIADPVSVTVVELQQHALSSAQRVLLRTRNSQLWSRGRFQEDFVYIEPGAAEYLATLGVRLVGIDYLSVDRFGDTSSPAHHALLGKGMVIVEGLDLSKVDPGTYTLVCLPLSITGAEGAPARAVLMR